jgi:aspartate-semialdehyde dehydrogenase
MASAREPRVAVVGATGAVGNQLLELIGARGFGRSGLRLFASERAEFETIEAGEAEFRVEKLENPAGLKDFDIAFLAVPEAFAAEIIAARPGPKLIDLSAAGRSPSGKPPLLAPGLTPRERVVQMRTETVFATPHPAAHVLATCLKALDLAPGFVAATAMLGASAGGKSLITRTVEQTTDLLSARLELEEGDTQRGFNLFMREHERAVASSITAQVRELLASPVELSLQVVSAPVLYGSSMAIAIPPRDDTPALIEKLRAAPGVLLTEEAEPLGVIDAVGQEAILVQAENGPHGLGIWCVFDNARIAALCALWIAETLSAISPALP